MIDHREYSFKTLDRLMLYAQSWSIGNTPKAVIGLIHGIVDHSSRFDYWARMFVKKGFAVMAYDLRGNGKSEGKRGHATSYETLLKDIELFYKETKHLFPHSPIFLYGHSLGGNLAINFAIRKKPKIQGLIVTSPWLKLYYEPENIAMKFGKILQYILPWFSFSMGISKKELNGDRPIINNFSEDQLLHDKISVKLYLESYKQGLWALKNIYKVNVPFLMMFGKEDKITSYRACEEYVNNTSEKTKLKIWEGCGHNLHNGPGHIKIHESIVRWLEENCNIARTKVKANEFVPN